MLPLFSLSLFTLISSCLGHPSGAPTSACGSMVPGHGGEAQDNNNSPFEVKVKQGKFVG